MAKELTVYLDIDGTLLPLPNEGDPLPPEQGGWRGGYSILAYGSMPIPYAPELIDRLNALEASGRVRFHWSTSWQPHLSKDVAELLGLDGVGWPALVPKQGQALAYSWKLAAIARDQAGRRPAGKFVWLDDDTYRSSAAREWVEQVGGHWISPPPASGILPAHVELIERLAGTLDV
ncbi:HAD domain-containing protein [Citricoccus nitrophenolicus]|uniref:HAD domain-containing protein n=1 Tax=Citricoccus nitrophenolicus TaxID=863575 RepID=UPI0031EC1956